jgi:hypothetical protein
MIASAGGRKILNGATCWLRVVDQNIAGPSAIKRRQSSLRGYIGRTYFAFTPNSVAISALWSSAQSVKIGHDIDARLRQFAGDRKDNA